MKNNSLIWKPYTDDVLKNYKEDDNILLLIEESSTCYTFKVGTVKTYLYGYDYITAIVIYDANGFYTPNAKYYCEIPDIPNEIKLSVEKEKKKEEEFNNKIKFHQNEIKKLRKLQRLD